MFRPDITETVDWALKPVLLYYYLPIWLEVLLLVFVDRVEVTILMTAVWLEVVVYMCVFIHGSSNTNNFSRSHMVEG